ncbi:MAG: Cna B-type domain-containing protein [Oscillospiraceae bacterium]|nr:Cna B-type domain-containing protein [Oscillospiraceae bacterium]
MKKRLFCILLTLVMMFTLLPCSVLAEDGETTPPRDEITDPNVPDDSDIPENPDVPNEPDTPDVPDTLNESNHEPEVVYPDFKLVLEGSGGKKLKGGVFALKGADDAAVTEWTTDENGEIQIDYHADGDYVLEQTKSHDWYELGAESKWKLTISDAGMTVALYRFGADGMPEAAAAATATAETSAVFTVPNVKKLGALVIAKAVSYEKDGTAAETADWTAADENEAYEIAVTLTDENGTAFTGTLGNVEFTEGSAVIVLKDSDTLSLEGIPYGSKYTVTPKTANTEVVCTVDNGENTITQASVTATVSYRYRFVTCNEGLRVLWVNSENTEQLVTGGKLALLNSDSEVIAECEAGVEKKLYFDVSEEGTYTLTETQTPAGYFAQTGGITVTAAKETKVVEGVTEEHMVFTAEGLENAADGGFLLKSAPIKPVTISVRAVWGVPDGFTATPAAVEVQLYRDGTAYGDPVTLNAENNWQHSWSGGAYTNAYAWDVEQTEVPAGYTEAIVTEDGYAFSVVNKLEYSNVTVSVSKSWLNPKNYDKQPVSVQVVLYRNGIVYDTVTLGESNGWTHRWRNLPNCFVWTVDEPTVPENYKKKITHVGNAWVIVNAHEEIPLTGDDSHVGLWAGATAAALAGLGVCAFLLLKKRKDDDE